MDPSEGLKSAKPPGDPRVRPEDTSFTAGLDRWLREDGEGIFVQINCAASVDGKLATKRRRQVRISSDEDMTRVHILRSRFDAICVGIGTVLADDPKLTARVGSDPVRVVMDSEARTPPDAELFLHGDSPVIIAASNAADWGRVEALEDAGAEVLRLGQKRPDPAMLIDALRDRGIASLLIEGGGTVNWGFFEADLVDRVSVFTGGQIFGGASAPTVIDGEGFEEEEAPELKLENICVLGGGVLTEWSVLYG